jgi:hypothetical protein
MKLAVVGSQLKSWKGEDHRLKAITMIRAFLVALEPEFFISGGADGVDTWAENLADLYDIPKKIFYPEQQNWLAYKSRNILIASECEALVSIRSIHSKTYGSGWTADYTESLGKKVWRFDI